MKKIVLTLVLLSLAACNSPSESYVYEGDEAQYQSDSDQGSWAGPGWYYGFYFSTPAPYWAWREGHPNWWNWHHRYRWHNRWHQHRYHRHEQRHYHHGGHGHSGGHRR